MNTKLHTTPPADQVSQTEAPGAQRPAYGRDTKLRRIGGSLGVILPREALNVLGFKEGVMLRATFSGDRIVLAPANR